MMERYFLHIEKVGGRILEDEEGSELRDLQAAHEEASKDARDLLGRAIAEGRELDTVAIIVTNDQGQDLDRVLLTAVLPNNLLPHLSR
jgi:hypothetical protein